MMSSTDPKALRRSDSLVIQTERLVLRPVRREDEDALHRLWTEPLVRRFLFDDEVVSREWVREEIERTLACFRDRGFGQWAVRRSGSEELIGFCGFRCFHEQPEPQLLYGMHPSVWGEGLATEAARAMIRCGFEELGFPRIVASADAPNAASLRVMEKSGLTFSERTREHGRDTIYHVASEEGYHPAPAPYRLERG